MVWCDYEGYEECDVIMRDMKKCDLTPDDVMLLARGLSGGNLCKMEHESWIVSRKRMRRRKTMSWSEGKKEMAPHCNHSPPHYVVLSQAVTWSDNPKEVWRTTPGRDMVLWFRNSNPTLIAMAQSDSKDYTTTSGSAKDIPFYNIRNITLPKSHWLQVACITSLDTFRKRKRRCVCMSILILHFHSKDLTIWVGRLHTY